MKKAVIFGLVFSVGFLLALVLGPWSRAQSAQVYLVPGNPAHNCPIVEDMFETQVFGPSGFSLLPMYAGGVDVADMQEAVDIIEEAIPHAYWRNHTSDDGTMLDRIALINGSNAPVAWITSHFGYATTCGFLIVPDTVDPENG